MSRLPRPYTVLTTLFAALALQAAQAGAPGTGAAGSTGLPPAVAQALARAQVPASALSVIVQEAGNPGRTLLSHEATVLRNPASVMKLVTTQAALELLGPAYTWKTPVYLDGPVRDGVLQGNVYIQGQGDPQLVVERLWLLMRRLQGLGVREIRGDIVLDHSAFEVPPADPGDFDGEPLRPYTASPDALLVNFRSVVLTFTPELPQASTNGAYGAPSPRMARLSVEPPLAGVAWPAQVPLRPAPCGDYRGELRADFSDPQHPRFAGSYPTECGEKVWPLAFADPNTYADRVVEGLWRNVGGELRGRVHEGRVPAGLAPAYSVESPPLTEIVRNINKYSNNVMAQQLFLTLSLQQRGRGTRADSRAIVETWWREQLGDASLPPPSISNGAGLSRDDRISAAGLAALLQHIWSSPYMPELLSALPIAGLDGTLRPQRWRADAMAHLKTGSLRDAASIAGIVQAAGGRRYVVVAIVNHPGANAARPALEALVSWEGRAPAARP